MHLNGASLKKQASTAVEKVGGQPNSSQYKHFKSNFSTKALILASLHPYILY